MDLNGIASSKTMSIFYIQSMIVVKCVLEPELASLFRQDDYSSEFNSVLGQILSHRNKLCSVGV